MSRVVDTWTCVKCGASASSDQNFCRSCGTPRGPKRPAPITAQVPVVGRHTTPTGDARPYSRVRLVFIAILFVVIGGLAALAFDDLRGDEPTDPAPRQPATTTVPPTATT